ncbi:hypothetical protein K470DRAFT_245902 [Piedraia hortae CBS 480.64]|uniref:Uncharacterized protein n=1 Tax=Piedraia hortae CBS 480.64 TaxID=1314780 RepID=A0A6A7C116_9PEZI|nr:hypothetical protein K470DRAFT_245902 [Piedraia hortae CBS 480.64]
MSQLIRRLRSKRNSQTSSLQVSTSQGPAFTSQLSQHLQLHNVPVQTQATMVASRNPFQNRDQLMLDVLAALKPDDRKFVKEQLQSNSGLVRDAAGVIALRGQNQTRRSSQWTARMRRIAGQMMQFASVFDVATNVQAGILSLPWAGIRSLLMVAQKSQEQSESILKGVETVLDTSFLLNAYFDLYSKLDGTPSIEHLYNNIVKLYGVIWRFLAHAHHTCDMKWIERTIHSLTDDIIPNFKNDHDGILTTVQFHIKAVDLEISEGQRAWVNERLIALKKAQEEINERVKDIQQTLDLDALQMAPGAAYNSIYYHHRGQNGEPQLCLEGTRLQIRQKVLDWATNANEQRVFWLSGKAGTGKSTIARTIAHDLDKQGYLVGSFFFKRGQGELGHVRCLFPTIARQMAQFIPSIRNQIADATHGFPPVKERALTSQFDNLIKEPLSGYNTGHATDVRVIVIDALDECEDWGAIGNAIALWPTLRAHTSMNLRVFVTSRTDNKVGDKLSRLEHKDLQHERLELLQMSTIKHDLTMLCHHELKKLREESRNEWSYDELEDYWPGEVVVNKLVDISQPLSIAASTIFREVRNNPRQRLQRWVDRLTFSGTDALTVIYADILEQAADLDKEWLIWFNKIIKPIAFLQSPLTISALTDLLGGGDLMLVTNALKPLSPVIDFPSGKEVKAGSRATVRIYHESFRDFLVDSDLRGKSPFWTDKDEMHGVLLSKCTSLLQNRLCRDICKRKSPAAARESVPPEHIDKHISESVEYACCNWVHHAIQSHQSIQDGGQVDCFLRAYFLSWTESMAWLDKLGEMVSSLKQLQKAIDATCSPELHSFVADALKWVPAHRNMIINVPLQTYLSALAFAPINSIVQIPLFLK